MDIILARHGETDWNAGEIFWGRADVELNETGIKQARLLAKYLSEFDIEAVYSSPLKRALKTAEAVARYHKLKVQIEHGLIDFDYGIWQGLSHQEIKEKYKESYAQWKKRPQDVKMPGGESLSEVRERAVSVINRAVDKHKGAVVLVSHRVVNKVLICALVGLDDSHLWNLRLDTCGITTFAHEGERFILNEHNNTCFLKPMQKTKLADF